MIDFGFDTELELLRDTTQKFSEEMLLPSLRDAESARAVSAAVRQAFQEIGLADLELPESQGGADLGSLARVLVNEELAAADAGAALALDSLGAALYPLLELGGDAAVAGARTEAKRAAIVVEARDRPAGPIAIDVPWVPADAVDTLLVLGPTAAHWITDGIVCEPVRGAGLRAAGACRLRSEASPRESWQDEPAAQRARARARLYVASLLLGVLRATCIFSRRYALEREAFGRPIAHHQALAFLITDMNTALECTRSLVHEAAWRLDEGLDARQEAAVAFAECIEVARFIGPAGVQILGGHGFMQDYPVEKHMREARALSALAGGFDQSIDEAGRALCNSEAPLALARWARTS